jgi:hypothetical protein
MKRDYVFKNDIGFIIKNDELLVGCINKKEFQIPYSIGKCNIDDIVIARGVADGLLHVGFVCIYMPDDTIYRFKIMDDIVGIIKMKPTGKPETYALINIP